MLSVSKNKIYEYMRQNNFDWREDSSNMERDYKRNQVRIDLVPILQTLAGGEDALYHRVQALSEQSKEINDLLKEKVSRFSLK
jgi:tRNA(Ile)-lysidine synthase